MAICQKLVILVDKVLNMDIFLTRTHRFTSLQKIKDSFINPPELFQALLSRMNALLINIGLQDIYSLDLNSNHLVLMVLVSFGLAIWPKCIMYTTDSIL